MATFAVILFALLLFAFTVGAYGVALYNGLVRLDTNAHVTMDLAEEFLPSKDARTWRIRLKKGVEFHNGKTLSAQDVIFTLKRIADPKKPLNGANALKPIDRNAMQLNRLVGDLLYTNLRASRWAVPLAERGIEQGLMMRSDNMLLRSWV